jgi:hypothetical protein
LADGLGYFKTKTVMFTTKTILIIAFIYIIAVVWFTHYTVKSPSDEEDINDPEEDNRS